MSKHLYHDLSQTRSELLSLFAVVEEMIDQAVRALCERRADLVPRIIEKDNFVDQSEVRIERECLRMLALHQPVASNLRLVSTVIKVVNDLERIADLACNIAERAQSLREFPLFPIPDQLPSMAANASEMLREALNAFVNMSVETAARVIRLDNEIDRQNRQLIDELRELMQDRPEYVEPALHVFSGTRHIERIGDHAENIAENVIFLVDGRIVRHQHGNFQTNPSSQ